MSEEPALIAKNNKEISSTGKNNGARAEEFFLIPFLRKRKPLNFLLKIEIRNRQVCIPKMRIILGEVEINKMNTEQKFKHQIIQRLEHDFEIRKEWTGKCFDKNVRIDALLKPRKPELWANKDLIIGIEFKRDIFKSAINEQLNGIKQCIDYSYTKWKGIGHIPVFFCPGFKISKNDGYDTMSKLLGRFNVGELRETHRGLALIMAENHFIWDEKVGVCEGRKGKLQTKTGYYR